MSRSDVDLAFRLVLRVGDLMVAMVNVCANAPTAMTIGRSLEADVTLPLCDGLSDIVATLSTSSPALVDLGIGEAVQTGDFACEIRDNESASGVFVNGSRVSSALLTAGDVVTFEQSAGNRPKALSTPSKRGQYLPYAVPTASVSLTLMRLRRKGGIASLAWMSNNLGPPVEDFEDNWLRLPELCVNEALASSIPPLTKPTATKLTTDIGSVSHLDIANHPLFSTPKGMQLERLYNGNKFHALLHASRLVLGLPAPTQAEVPVPKYGISGVEDPVDDERELDRWEASAKQAAAAAAVTKDNEGDVAAGVGAGTKATRRELDKMATFTKGMLSSCYAQQRGLYMGDVCFNAAISCIQPWGLTARRLAPRVVQIASVAPHQPLTFVSMRYPVEVAVAAMAVEGRFSLQERFNNIASAFRAVQNCERLAGRELRPCRNWQSFSRAMVPVNFSLHLLVSPALGPDRPLTSADLAQAAAMTDGPQLVATTLLPAFYCNRTGAEWPITLGKLRHQDCRGHLATAFFAPSEDPLDPRAGTPVGAAMAPMLRVNDCVCSVVGTDIVPGRVLPRAARDAAIASQALAIALRWWRALKHEQLAELASGLPATMVQRLEERITSEHWLSVRQFLHEESIAQAQHEGVDLVPANGLPDDDSLTGRAKPHAKTVDAVVFKLVPRFLPSDTTDTTVRASLQFQQPLHRDISAPLSELELSRRPALLGIARDVVIGSVYDYWTARCAPEPAFPVEHAWEHQPVPIASVGALSARHREIWAQMRGMVGPHGSHFCTKESVDVPADGLRFAMWTPICETPRLRRMLTGGIPVSQYNRATTMHWEGVAHGHIAGDTGHLLSHELFKQWVPPNDHLPQVSPAVVSCVSTQPRRAAAAAPAAAGEPSSPSIASAAAEATMPAWPTAAEDDAAASTMIAPESEASSSSSAAASAGGEARVGPTYSLSSDAGKPFRSEAMVADGPGAALDSATARAVVHDLVALAPLNHRGTMERDSIMLVPLRTLRPGPVASSSYDASAARSRSFEAFRMPQGRDDELPTTSPFCARPDNGNNHGFRVESSQVLTGLLRAPFVELRRLVVGLVNDLSTGDSQDFASLPTPVIRAIHTLFLCRARDRIAVLRKRVTSTSSSSSASLPAAEATRPVLEPLSPSGLGLLPLRVMRRICEFMVPLRIDDQAFQLVGGAPSRFARCHHADAALAPLELVQRRARYEEKMAWLKKQAGADDAQAAAAAKAKLGRISKSRMGVFGCNSDLLRNSVRPDTVVFMTVRASLRLDPGVLFELASAAERAGIPGDGPLDGANVENDVGLDAKQTVGKAGRELQQLLEMASLHSAHALDLYRPCAFIKDDHAFAVGSLRHQENAVAILPAILGAMHTMAASGGADTIGTGLNDLPRLVNWKRSMPQLIGLQYGPYQGPWKRDAVATAIMPAGATSVATRLKRKSATITSLAIDAATARAMAGDTGRTDAAAAMVSSASQSSSSSSSFSSSAVGATLAAAAESHGEDVAEGAAIAAAGAAETSAAAGSEQEDGSASSGDAFDMFHILESARPPHQAPHLPTPCGMGTTELLPYQQRALAWMHAVEDGMFAEAMGPQPAPQFDAVQIPLWSDSPTAPATHSALIFSSRAGRSCVTLQPPTARPPPAGGILADEMGLGKTLEVAALVLARRREPGTYADCSDDFPWGQRIDVRRILSGSKPTRKVVQVLGEEQEPVDSMSAAVPVAANGSSCASVSSSSSSSSAAAVAGVGEESDGRRSRRATRQRRPATREPAFLMLNSEQAGLAHRVAELGCPAQQAAQLARGDLPHSDSAIVPIKATLIVAPQPLVSQWAEELTEHAPGLRVLLYEGVAEGMSTRQPYGATASEDFVDADVVLCSYDALRHDQRKHSPRMLSPLLMVEWFRIVLDEAQMVSSSASATSKMVADLGRVHAWCVSGTPMSNRVSDLHGLLTFLAFVPFANLNVLSSTVLQPFGKRMPAGLSRMRGLMQTIMWRHRKDHVASEIHLPPLTTEDIWIDQTSIEQSIYERLHTQIKRRVAKLLYDASKQEGGVWRLENVRSENPAMASASAVTLASRRRKAQTLSASREAAAAAASGGGSGGGAVPPELARDLMKLRQMCCHPTGTRTGGSKALRDGTSSLRDVFEVMVQQAVDTRGNRARDEMRAHLAIGEAGCHGVFLPPPSLSAAAAKTLTVDRRMRALQACAAVLGTGRDSELAESERSDIVSSLSALSTLVPHTAELVEVGIDTETVAKIAVAETANDGKLQLKKSKEGDCMIPPAWRFRQEVDAGMEATVCGLHASVDAAVTLAPWLRLELRLVDAAIQLRGLGGGSGLGSDPRWRVKSSADGESTAASSSSSSTIASHGSLPAVSMSDVQSSIILKAPRAAVAAALLKPATPEDLAASPLMSLLARRACLATHLGEDTLTKMAKTTVREHHQRKGKAAAEAARAVAEAEAAAAAAHKAAAVAKAKKEAAAVARALGRVTVDENALAAARELVSLEDTIATAAADLRQAKADVRRMREQLAAADASLTASVGGVEVGLCPVCFDSVDRPAITPCHHVLCDDCASTIIASAAASGREPSCPALGCFLPFSPDSLLRGSSAPTSLALRDEDIQAGASEEPVAGVPQPLSASSSVRSVVSSHIDAGTMASLLRQAQALRHATTDLAVLQNQFGSKVTELVRRLAIIKGAEPEAKVVVFSQWVGVLEVVGEAIGSCGVLSKRLVSSSSSDTLASFRRDPLVSVLLVSTKQGGGAAGLTLTMAHHLFLMEPSTNVGLEDQAKARVHRIGQRQPVTVHRLLTRGSVEEGILQVQERKRGTKASQTATSSETLSLLDLCRIFRLFSDDDGVLDDTAHDE